MIGSCSYKSMLIKDKLKEYKYLLRGSSITQQVWLIYFFKIYFFKFIILLAYNE